MTTHTLIGWLAFAFAGAAHGTLTGGLLFENTVGSMASPATVDGPARVYEQLIVSNKTDGILNSIGNARITACSLPTTRPERTTATPPSAG